MDVIGTYEDSITNMEGWRLHVLKVGRLGHGVLGILRVITEETVNLVEINGKMMCS